MGIVFLLGCNKEAIESNIEIISVSPDDVVPFLYDKYVVESAILPLQKKPENYLGVVNRLYVKNNLIAIVSTGKVFIYSLNNGELLSMINKKGKGPGEYQTIDDIFLETDLIYVLDRLNRAIWIYDFKGNFVEEIDTRLTGYTFTKTATQHFSIYTNSDRSEKSDYRLNFYSSRQSEITKKYFRITDSEYNWQYIDDLRNFILSNNNTYFVRSFNDTVYVFDENRIKPVYFVDFGKYSTPADFLKRDYEDIIDFTSKASKKNYIYSIIGFHHIKNYIYFAYRFQEKFIHCIYSLNSKKVISFNSFENYLNVKGLNEETNFYNFPLTNDDNYFYALIQPSLIREKLQKREEFCPGFVLPLLNSTEDDNPFLLKFKLTDL